MADKAAQDETDKNIEMWKVKRVSDARGWDNRAGGSAQRAFAHELHSRRSVCARCCCHTTMRRHRGGS